MKEPTKKTTSPTLWSTSTGIMVATGVVFGYAMNKGQVHLPSVIQDQMSFGRFTMMKLFLAALGTSATSKAAFRALHPAAFEGIQEERASEPSHAAVLAAGGLILGAGMTLSGSCPGSVYVQLGAGIPSAVPVFAGALAGTLLFGFLQPMITQWQQGKARVQSTLHVSTAIQCIVGVALIGASAGLELIFPESLYPVSASPTWSPTVAGVVVGALQLPLVFFLGRSLGSISSYKIIVGRTVDAVRHVFGCFPVDMPLIADLSTLLFVIGVVAGSMAAGAPSPASLAAGPPTPLALVGGVLLGFGANLASGCTSGHGFSGVAMLMTSSMIVLPCIFAGAMGTALVSYLL
ncbi:Aste57867_291 [Aphanomyces stellatus]|uniref:Aste57867_291 protein n=1 Tax=Aphanomyces stellatus TaxID=120398 RepID=A0A485K2F8_9STRA|nr:hypothetical protein As57867_000291 [Aphanomyces stellatus]VFT77517.1 Aste57867_291 [Aphanomyces stellatus]